VQLNVCIFYIYYRQKGQDGFLYISGLAILATRVVGSIAYVIKERDIEVMMLMLNLRFQVKIEIDSEFYRI
jgi:hypothetical protein